MAATSDGWSRRSAWANRSRSRMCSIRSYDSVEARRRHRGRIVQAVQDNRQHRPAIALDALGKQQVVVGIDRVAFREDQIQSNRPGALKTVQQRGMDRPPPGPSPQRFDAGVINGDDQNIRVSRAAAHGDGAVVQNLIDPAQAIQQAQQGRQRRQYHRQPQP